MAANELFYIILRCGPCISFLIKNWASQIPSKPESSGLKIVLKSTKHSCPRVYKYLKWRTKIFKGLVWHDCNIETESSES